MITKDSHRICIKSEVNKDQIMHFTLSTLEFAKKFLPIAIKTVSDTYGKGHYIIEISPYEHINNRVVVSKKIVELTDIFI